jgi:DNA repair exonuclease SbcCD nuclease subunit
MIVWHIADTHIEQGPRWAECTRILDHFATLAEHDPPDLILHAGDMFHKKSTPVEMQFAERWVQRLANVCPVVIVRGNHDTQHEIESFSRLKATNSIVAVEYACLFDVAGISVACLPWPTKSGVILQSDALSLGQTSDDAMDHLRAILHWLGGELDKRKGPSILLSHAMVRGSKTAAGQPLTGCDFELTLEDLHLVHADAYALGHIHKAQAWQPGYDGGAIFRYSGSPFHTDFGDWFEKSFTRWEFNSEGLAGYSTVELPAHQMIEIKARNVEQSPIGACPCYIDDEQDIPEDVTGIEFKLKYTTAPERAKAARAAAERWRDQQLAAGAYSVVLAPEVLTTTRARAPEVSEAASPEDKLIAHWRSKGEDPDDALHRELLDKFREATP